MALYGLSECMGFIGMQHAWKACWVPTPESQTVAEDPPHAFSCLWEVFAKRYKKKK